VKLVHTYSKGDPLTPPLIHQKFFGNSSILPENSKFFENSTGPLSFYYFL
jgi:hypothetical protein